MTEMQLNFFAWGLEIQFYREKWDTSASQVQSRDGPKFMTNRRNFLACRSLNPQATTHNYNMGSGDYIDYSP